MKHLFRLLIAPVALAALFSAGRFAFADETAAERLARLNAERIVWLDGGADDLLARAETTVAAWLSDQ